MSRHEEALLELRRIAGNIRARTDELDAAIGMLLEQPVPVDPPPIVVQPPPPVVVQPEGLGWGPGPRSGLAPWFGFLCREPGEFAAMKSLVGQRKLDLMLAEIGRKEEVHQLQPSKSPKLRIACETALREGVDTLCISTPLFWDPESPKEKGARLWIEAGNGRRSEVWRKGAADLFAFVKRYGIRHVIARPAWESGHEAFGHTACVCASEPEVQGYKDALTHYSDIIRDEARKAGLRVSISLSHIKDAKFPGRGNHQMHPRLDAFDLWGLDYYGTWEPQNDEEAWERVANSTYLGGPRGIYTHLAYARSIGKPFSVEEWGIANWKGDERKMKTGAHGGDSAFFVKRMARFGRENAADMAYMLCYGTAQHQLGTALSPKASQEYAKAYRA